MLVLALAALAALFGIRARWRLARRLLGLVAVALAAALAADALTPPGNRVVRIAPGAGFWLLLLSLGLLAADAITRMKPRPLPRVLCLALALGVAIAGACARHLR